MANSEEKLLSMGLSPPHGTDECIRNIDYASKAGLQGYVKITDTELARYDSFWRKTDHPRQQTNEVSCNVPIWLAKVSAVIPAGNAGNAAPAGNDNPGNNAAPGNAQVTLDARYYLCKDETAVWAKNYLRFSTEAENNKSRLRSTAPAHNYDVKHYERYIPHIVRGASDKYITTFVNHHTNQHPRLTKEMVTISFISFMCYEISGEQPAIDDHVETVHGFTDGVEMLKENQIIQVDSKITLTLPSLLDIELLGPDKRKNAIRNIFMTCVARDVFKQSTNEANSDLNRSRSIELMAELKKSCNNTYFERFKMHLTQLIGSTEDIDSNFSCKWSEFSTALTNAINTDQNVVRLSNFLSKNYESFHSLPLELLIGNVDKWVDSVQGTSTLVTTDPEGRTISEYTWNTLWKYAIIFNIAEHLPGDMRQLKEVITKKITEIIDTKSTLIDIPAFQKFLITEFEKKSILTTYRSENVPAPKKGISVNETSVDKGKGKGKGDRGDKPEDPENVKKFKSEFEKSKINPKLDKANTKLYREKAIELANDPKNAEAEVINHPDM